MTTKNIILGLLGLAVIGLVIFYVKNKDYDTLADQNTTASSTASWQSSDDQARGIAFKYPADFGTTYIQPVDWPPQVAVIDGPLKCTEAGSATSTAGVTKKETINSRVYCVTKEVQGAAGSTYTQYAYASQMSDGRVAILTFTIRAPQCGNYNEPKKTECQTEEDNFSLSSTVDQMFGTLKLGPASLDYQKG